MEMLMILGLLTVICEEVWAITRLSSSKPFLGEEWQLNYDRNYERDSRSSDGYPKPQLPWEEALRHSIYLTLVRDKIDTLITKQTGDNHEENDVNLWRELRKAPFIAHKKERGPIFGDIAILSRGKLLETDRGLVFVEDENAKECIECHIYSARLNELEAERMLGKGANIRALWTVRRIRHRNYDEKSPYRYELMFSIASARSEGEGLNYNVPTQTFTITETDRTVPATNLYRDVPKHPIYEPSTERTAWTPKNAIQFPEYNPYYKKPNLNTGEIYTEPYYEKIKPTPYYETVLQNLNNREQKKYVETDKVYLDGEYHVKKDGKRPTITHLHHHYYLNDKGVPIVRFPTNTVKPYQYYTDITEDYARNPIVYNEDTPASGSNSATIPIYVPETAIQYVNVTESSTKPVTLQMNMRSTTSFKPSPEEVNVRYSELDPLYPPTLSTPTSYVTEAQIDFKDEHTNLPTATPVEEYITEHVTHTRNNHLDSLKDLNLDEKVIAEPIEVSTKKLTTTRRRRPEKPMRTPTRRPKTQKNFSELYNVQLPAPDKNTDTTVPYNVTTVTELFAESISEPEVSPTATATTEKSNHTLNALRNTQRKYQRKYNTWGSKRVRSKPTEKSTTVTESTTQSISSRIDEHPSINDSESNESNNQTTILAIAETTEALRPENTASTISVDTETAVQTSISYSNTSRLANDDEYSPQTRKSYVTSISFKLGNKTQPFLPRSTTPSIDSNTTIEELFQSIEVSNVTRAEVSHVNTDDYAVYKAEDGADSSDVDRVTQDIIEHAKSVQNSTDV